MTESRRRVSDKVAEQLSGWASKLHISSSSSTGSASEVVEQPPSLPVNRRSKREAIKRRLVWPPEEWLAKEGPSHPDTSRSLSSSQRSEASDVPEPRFDDEPPHLRKLMVSDEDRPLTLAQMSTQHLVDEPEEMPPEVIVDEPEEMVEEPTEISEEPEELVDEPQEMTEEPGEMHLDIPSSSSSHHFLPSPASLTPGSHGSPALVASPGGMEEGEEPPTPPATRSTTAQTSIDESYPFPKPPRHPYVRAEGSQSQVKETHNARASTHADGTRMLNQYVLLDSVSAALGLSSSHAAHSNRTALGRGSFGLVQAAIDAETGEEYAIKELSRARLKRKAQREAHRRAREIRQGIASSEGRAPDPNPEDVGHEQTATQIDALYLIRNEIAIMKKVRPAFCSVGSSRQPSHRLTTRTSYGSSKCSMRRPRTHSTWSSSFVAAAPSCPSRSTQRDPASLCQWTRRTTFSARWSRASRIFMRTTSFVRPTVCALFPALTLTQIMTSSALASVQVECD